MNDFQEPSGPPPERPINGYKIPTKSVSEDTAAKDRPQSTDQEATRYLCAATQISIPYAESVVGRVIDEHFRALAPTFGVDVTVVAKWALKALRARALRDYVLAAILALVLADLTVPFLWLSKLILLVLLLATAWQTVSLEYWERIHNTVIRKMLRDRFDPAKAPSPSKKTDRARLAEVAKRREGNLVVFSGHSAFIGSGQTLRSERVIIDASRGKEAYDGRPMDPDHFTSHDLHTAIVQAFSHKAGLARSLANIRIREKLFVNGMHIHYDDRLLPDPLRPPPTSIGKDLIIAAALQPTPDARTYVCVEMPGWQGQLVVTLYIRAVHTGKWLYLDWTFQVLPPLRHEFLRVDHLHELSHYGQRWTSMRASLRKTIPTLLRSPYAALRAWRRPHRAQRDQSRQSAAIENGYIFDYGARRSIREVACGMRRQHYFLARDEIMYMLLAQQTLTRAVETFLEDHNVNLGLYKDQVKVIFDNSINVGNINDSTGVTIGNNSSSTVDDSPQGEK